MVLEGFTVTEPPSKKGRIPRRLPSLLEKYLDKGGMLEISETKAADKEGEEDKRKKAKLLKKLKEQEGLVNANNQVMVRDRRRPRKSIKEMSVLNKRRRVIKNTARKEIAQQRATLESMRHIEMKRYSLEARELELFVERVRKVKENKRLSMLFSKFKVSDSEEDEGSVDQGQEEQNNQVQDNASEKKQDQKQSTPVTSRKGGLSVTAKTEASESMTNLIRELNSMTELIDLDTNPQWRYIMGLQSMDSESKSQNEQSPEEEEPAPPPTGGGGPIMFGGGSRFSRKDRALEAPAELQSINRFPSIPNNDAVTSRDDSELGSIRRCMSQPSLENNNNRSSTSSKAPALTSMPTLYSDVELISKSPSKSPSPKKSATPKKPSYHSNWREREKRGDPLYSPVALSPIQNGLASPDIAMEEVDELTERYRRQLNPRRYQAEGFTSGDMEFKQAMNKMPHEKGPKKVGYQGTHSIIEMQLNTKTKNITDKVTKVRRETMKSVKSAKSVAAIIHQKGDSNKFLEEVRMLRSFAAMCNCKYLRTDPEKLDERRQQYIDDLVANVSKRVQIRNKWRLSMKTLKPPPPPPTALQSVSLPVIAQGAEN